MLFESLARVVYATRFLTGAARQGSQWSTTSSNPADSDCMTTPVVSILIPNFNNGPSSAIDGQRDFLGDLLQSLHDSLHDDPTPVQIIIADDGSTDESLETARQWSNQTWTQGGREVHPFCTLIELQHTGVLSIVANRLTHESKGEILVRLDGDIVVHTKHWASELKRIFDNAPPDVGVVGPLQLSPDGFVHSAGDWLLHPRGYHHIAQGAARSAITRSSEVDHVMGCFYCFRRSVWNAVGEYDETILRGQTVDYTMRARTKSFRVWCVPTIVFTHYHSKRKQRDNTADKQDGLQQTLQRFRDKWGFDRLAPDLDAAAERYTGTPLLWNARVFGPRTDETQMQTTLENSRWTQYADNEALQAGIGTQVAVALQAINEHQQDGPIVQYGCGDGLVCHLLAQRGVYMVGIDSSESKLSIARQMTGAVHYADSPPTFIQQSDPQHLPIETGEASCVLLLNVLERHPNPVGLLKQSHHALRPGGCIVLTSTPRQQAIDNDNDHVCLFRAHELDALLRNVNLFDVPNEAPPDTAVGMVRVLRSRNTVNAQPGGAAVVLCAGS